MKRLYSIILIAMFFATGSASGQAITLGTGTAVNGTTTAGPINIWWESGKMQWVYTAAELNTAGATGGFLDSIGWYVTGGVTPSGGGFIPNYEIKIRHTNLTATTPATAVTTGFTSVYTNPSYNPPAGGYDMLGLTTPFFWNGVDNLMVEVCYGVVNGFNQSGQCRVYGSNGDLAFGRQDNTSICPNAYTSGSSIGNTFKPQARLKFSQFNDDMATTGLVNPTLPACSLNNQDVIANVINAGLNTVTSFTVNWTINGAAQTGFTFSNDSLVTGQDSAITLGTGVNFTTGDAIRVWTTMPNGTVDSNNVNDTTDLIVSPAMTGNYTMNPNAAASATNFTSIAAVNTALNAFGVCGHAIITIDTGSHPGLIDLSGVQYATGMDSITFIGIGNDSSAVRIFNNSNSNAANFVINVARDNVTIQGLTLENNSVSQGRVITYSGANLNINHCKFESPSTTSFNNSYNTIFLEDGMGDLSITNTNFINGRAGVGHNFNLTSNATNFEFSNNTLENFYTYGVEYRPAGAKMIFRNNTITRSSNFGTPYGFYVGADRESEFSGNYINVESTGGAYGMFCAGFAGTLARPINVFNNCIKATNGTSTFTNAVQLNNCYITNFDHNTILASYPTNATTTFSDALEIFGGFGNTFTNCMIVNESAGTAARFNANPIYNGDNNIFYTNGTNVVFSGGTGYPTLAGLTSALSVDANSTFGDPSIGFANGNCVACDGIANGTAGGTPISSVDKDGNTRPAKGADIGAVEYDPFFDGIGSPRTFCAPDSTEIKYKAGDAFEFTVGANVSNSQGIWVSQTTVFTSWAYSMVCADTVFDTVVVVQNTPVNLGSDRSICGGDSVQLNAGSYTSYAWNDGSNNQTLIANQSGTFSVTTTDASGCLTEDSVKVVVQDPADLGVDTFVCIGDSITLSAGINGTYSWDDGTTSMTRLVKTLGTYSVTVTDPIGCVTSDDIFVNVKDTAEPIATLSSSGLAAVFTNNSLNATSFIWNWGDGTNSTDVNGSHIYATGGSYFVTLTASNADCGPRSVVFEVIVEAIGIEEFADGESISYFPNPATDKLSLSLNGISEPVTVSLFDITGKQIANRYFGVNELREVQSMDLTTVASGSYLLKLVKGSEELQSKILITK